MSPANIVRTVCGFMSTPGDRMSRWSICSPGAGLPLTVVTKDKPISPADRLTGLSCRGENTTTRGITMNLKSFIMSSLPVGCPYTAAWSVFAADPVIAPVEIQQVIVSPIAVSGTASGFEPAGPSMFSTQNLGTVTIAATGATPSALGTQWTGTSVLLAGQYPSKGLLVNTVDATKTIQVAADFPAGSTMVTEGTWWKRTGTDASVAVQINVDGAQTATAGNYTGTLNVGAWD